MVLFNKWIKNIYLLKDFLINIKKFVIFLSLLFNFNIKEIYNNLLVKLINGYVGYKENLDSYVCWKM